MSQIILPKHFDALESFAQQPQHSKIQIELFDSVSEAGLYHPENSGGFFSLLFQAPSKKIQRTFKVADMAKVLNLTDYSRDTWISQGEFFRPNRRVVNLARISLLFSDLDTYKVDGMRDLPIDAQIQRLHFVCSEEGIPPPSLVVFSGRGLQAKWLLDTPLPRAALPRWNACQRALQSSLKHIGADAQAKDASRVLRLVDSLHSKAYQIVRVVDVHGSIDDPARYNFDALADALLELTREEVQAKRQERADYKANRDATVKLVSVNSNSKKFKSFSGRTLAWARLDDLRKVGEMRGGWVGDNADSMRTAALHWQLNFLCLSGAAHPGNFHHEARELAKQIDPGWKFETDQLSTLLSKAKAYSQGEPVEFYGRKLPALYTPKNETLINIFGITDDEQRQLKTIITPDLARERHAIRECARRRSSGAVERSEYEENRKQQTENRINEIKRLKAEGLSANAIAKQIGVTARTVFNALKV